MADFERESMLDLFIFEMNQLLEQLEQLIIQGEEGYSMDDINEIFRIMHTIKGSAAMMLYDNVSKTAHAVEDLFYYLREDNPSNVDYSSLTDIVLEGTDFIKAELGKIQAGESADADPTEVIGNIKDYLGKLKAANGAAPAPEEAPAAPAPKAASASGAASASEAEPVKTPAGANRYRAKVKFENGCEMENVRAFTMIHNLQDTVTDVETVPEDVVAEASEAIIKKDGFSFVCSSEKTASELETIIKSMLYVESVEIQTCELNNYTAVIRFEDGCEMENVRAFTVVHNLEGVATNITHIPEDVIDDAATDVIRKDGFKLSFSIGKPYNDVYDMLSQTVFLQELELTQTNDVKTADQIVAKPQISPSVENVNVPAPAPAPEQKPAPAAPAPEKKPAPKAAAEQKQAKEGSKAAPAKKEALKQQMINVNVSKLDQLLNLMGELVISEAMTTQNPDLDGLELENFTKSARQLRKIINDVQDTVMSMRMVSLSTTFFKMHRIVRDMCKNLGKSVELVVEGEETEVDKNIIEHISDPLMHIIRNSVDHGVEMPEERRAVGKDEKGTVVLSARNAGGEVLITIKDDGEGINTEKVLAKAKAAGILKKPAEEYTQREICQFIFHAGLSTNDQVTSYSGRGVGMDVVVSNVEAVGGTILVESERGQGTTTILKIPLTLAIVEGMLIKMGKGKYTIPISSILETFKAKQEDIFFDPDGNEMITIRGEIYNVVRLYDFYGAETDIKNIEDGVLIMVENEGQSVCLFVDELIGEQQVVLKAMPKYIKKSKGIGGCTLLGNGDISLIVDVAGFFDK